MQTPFLLLHTLNYTTRCCQTISCQYIHPHPLVRYPEPHPGKGREIKWQSSRKYKQKVTEEIGALLPSRRGRAQAQAYNGALPLAQARGGGGLYTYILVHTYIKDDFSLQLEYFARHRPKSFSRAPRGGRATRGA